MPKEGTQENTANQPEPKLDGNRQKCVWPTWLSDTLAGFICVGFATILFTLGAALLNGHPKPLLTGWTLIYLGIIFFAGATYFGLKVHRKKQVKYKMPIWLPKWVFIGITIVGLFVSAFAVWQERPEGIPKNLPIVALELGPNLDPGSPTGQVFLVCNQGPGSIQDVACDFLWNDPEKHPEIVNAIVVSGGGELKPGMKQGVHCAGVAAFPIFSDRTFVNLSIEYAVDGFNYRTNANFRLCLYRNNNGTFTWVPAGEGESLPDLLGDVDKRVKRTICAQDDTRLS